MKTPFGIDISSHQNLTDAQFRKLRDLGCSFIIIRAAQGCAIPGFSGREDAKVGYHVGMCEKYNIPYGLYHWVDPILPPEKQAEFILNIIKRYNPSCFFADFEQYWKDWDEWERDDIKQKFSAEEIYNCYSKYFELVKSALKIPVGIYSADWFVKAFCPLLTPLIKTHPFWVASYLFQNVVVAEWEFSAYLGRLLKPVLPKDISEYGIWQFGERFALAGLPGMDFNIITNLALFNGEKDMDDRLEVTYVSQLDAGASQHNNDCGAACGCMLLSSYKKATITPDEFYNQINPNGDNYLAASQIMGVMRKYNLQSQWQEGKDLEFLYTSLCEKKPIICLIKYKPLVDAGLTFSKFTGPHFVVVVGINLKNVIIHDPLWKETGGKYLKIPKELFLSAWTLAGSELGNPTCGLIVPVNGMDLEIVPNPEIKKIRITADFLYIRNSPQILATNKVGYAQKNEVFYIIKEQDGFGRIQGNQERWIGLRYTEVIP